MFPPPPLPIDNRSCLVTLLPSESTSGGTDVGIAIFTKGTLNLRNIAFSFGGNQTVVDAAGGNAALLVALEAGSLRLVITRFTNFVNAIVYRGNPDGAIDPGTSVAIASSRFENNLRGAVVIDRVRSVQVSFGRFVGNENTGDGSVEPGGPVGGGLGIFSSEFVFITDSTFTDNVATFGGGGMHASFMSTRRRMLSSSINPKFC